MIRLIPIALVFIAVIWAISMTSCTTKVYPTQNVWQPVIVHDIIVPRLYENCGEVDGCWYEPEIEVSGSI